MSERVFLVEPKQLSIIRHGRNECDKLNSSQDEDIFTGERETRSAGDGMEWDQDSLTRHHERHYKQQQQQNNTWHKNMIDIEKPMATSTPALKSRIKNDRKVKEVVKCSKKVLKQIDNADSLILMKEKTENDHKIELENLKLKCASLQSHNEQLVEEKLKLSKQLGLQTQVNTELKTLLVASVGEDLEEKLEKMTLTQATSERLMKKLKEQLEDKSEESESITIQCDVWRSKFLASKLMTNELASLKAITDSRLRECSSALETLLQEHLQVATTIASSNRFLLRLAHLIGCVNCEAANVPESSSIDLAIANHSLAQQITHVAIQDPSSSNSNSNSKLQHDFDMKPYPQNNKHLSEGEKKAKKALDNAKSDNLRRNNEYLDDRSINQMLATKYPLKCFTCKGCKGKLNTI